MFSNLAVVDDSGFLVRTSGALDQKVFGRISEALQTRLEDERQEERGAERDGRMFMRPTLDGQAKREVCE